MKTLADCKNKIHSCSKCGLCQAVCPIYKITGNDCTVSRGQFIMLQGLINGELKMSKTINRYLDLCLKCNACTKYCPSGIDVVEIVALAKAEYFKLHKIEKIKSLILQSAVNLIHSVQKINIFTPKSKKFDKKVVYFAGCGGVQESVIKILNSLNIEVLTPAFDCCGFLFFIKGDLDSFKNYMDKFYSVLEKYDEYEIVTNCATCEKTLKSFPNWGGKEITVKNVFEYIRENHLTLELKSPKKVTYHKPCNLNNFDDVKYILENTKNLEYIKMKDFDKCCGGINTVMPDFKNRKIWAKLTKEKFENIKATSAKTILTSCFACKMVLGIFSFGKYKIQDFVEFLAKNIK